MDLGASFPTAPGSTAKVVSALAGLKKEGISAINKVYNVDPAEVIYRAEPGSKKNENVTMEAAIVESSNIYFINLVNDLDLYGQLRDIYLSAGIGVDGITPYLFENTIDNQSKFESAIQSTGDNAIQLYEKYRKARAEKQYRKMNNPGWGWAWGQGTMTATPLAMARAYSIVANKGNFVETKYLIDKKTKSVEMLSPNLTKALTKYMEDEAKAKGIAGIAAKTGTPERVTQIRKSAHSIQNDGWFVFFYHSDTYKAPITVAIRIERLDGGGSGHAVNLAKEVLRVTTKRENEIGTKK
jgi:cell division protein FtsI/penicillin-binding protein 2